MELPPESQGQTYATDGDSSWSFIDKIPAKATYFDGSLKCYDSDGGTILHLGHKYTPFWSVHTPNAHNEETDVLFAATREDKLSGVALFVKAEPQLEMTAELLAIAFLIHTRHSKSRCIMRLERSEVCINGHPPATRFLRKMLKVLPVAGVMCFAIFPGRDKRAVILARLATYIASFVSDMTFLQFQSEDEFCSWLRTETTSMAVKDLQEFDLFSEASANMRYFCKEFETLRRRWPRDSIIIADLLGETSGSVLSRRTSDIMRENHSEIASSVTVASNFDRQMRISPSAELGVESSALSVHGRRQKLGMTRITLDSIIDDDD